MGMVSDADIRAVTCPECNAGKGEPCVYLWPKNVDPDSINYLNARKVAQVARAGTPTIRPHNGRYNLAHERLRRRLRQQYGPMFLPATQVHRDAARAEVEYERREQDRLRDWLRQYAGILLNAEAENQRHQPVEELPGVGQGA